jgi:hypothetical protein
MTRRILIVTKLYDDHAHLVATGLERMGVEPLIFRYGMMPLYETHTVHLDDRARLYVDNAVLVDENMPLDRVWLRRIGGSSAKFMDISEHDRDFVNSIMAAYRGSLFALLDHIASTKPNTIVNSYNSKLEADSKVLQLWYARKAGLIVPETIQSNDLTTIREFQERHDNKIICKSLVPQMWQGNNRLAFSYTAILPHIDTLPPEAI